MRVAEDDAGGEVTNGVTAAARGKEYVASIQNATVKSAAVGRAKNDMPPEARQEVRTEEKRGGGEAKENRAGTVDRLRASRVADGSVAGKDEWTHAERDEAEARDPVEKGLR